MRNFSALSIMVAICFLCSLHASGAGEQGGKAETWKYSVLTESRIPVGSKVTHIWAVNEKELPTKMTVVEALDYMGKDGWELVVVDRNDSDRQMQTTTYFFKRRG